MRMSSEKNSPRFLEVNNCNIQDLSARDRRMLRPTGRVDYHLLYVLRGACYVTENGHEQKIEAGNLIIYRPGERQEYAFRAKDGSVSAFVHFSGTAVFEIMQELGAFEGRVVFLGVNKRLERVFRDMVDEFCLKRPYYAENAAALLLQFLALAARSVRGEGVLRAPAGDGVTEVLRHMHRHYDEEHGVAFYAAMCHLSEGRFAHAFKEVTGTSPKRYVLGLRVSAALDLLATTDLTVSQVATAVGVGDVNYFSRLIKKHTGRSPRDSRK